MSRSRFEGGTETAPEVEKRGDPIITAYVIRHGESVVDKTDPHRGLTDGGREQARAVGGLIAEEISQEADPDTIIELRGFDSGVDRSNQTLIEAVKVLVKKGYKVHLPYSSQELAESPDDLEAMSEKGLISVYGKKQRIRPEAIEYLRPVSIPKEARSRLNEKAQETGGDILSVMMSLPEDQLKAMGVETMEDAYQRMKTGENRTNEVARFLTMKDGDRNHRKRVVHIAISHGYIMGAFLRKELGIPEPFEEKNIPSGQGFRVDFTGKPGDPPHLELWGDEISNNMERLTPKK